MLRNLVGYPCDQTGSQPPLQLSHERLKGGNRKLFTGRPRGGTNYSGLSNTVNNRSGGSWRRILAAGLIAEPNRSLLWQSHAIRRPESRNRTRDR